MGLSSCSGTLGATAYLNGTSPFGSLNGDDDGLP